MITLLVLVASVFSTAATAENVQKRPNVVFILVDDTGYNDIGYNNRSQGTSPRILTPHIDALADAGIKLTNYYVQPICTPTRAALMTGRYPFRYGVNGYTIAAEAPWGIPLNEVFFPEFFKAAGFITAMFGKWHLGFFKPDFLPGHRGFDRQSGIYNALADHYTHEIGGGYDWHVNDQTCLSFKGNYSGDLVRDDAVAFINEMAAIPINSTDKKPFFLYVPFQEAHSPYQVDQKYRDMYPHLAHETERQQLAGMITHNDDMIGDIVAALKSTGVMENTILVFSADNGGPGGQELVPRPSRFDSSVIDRNYPYRGQKHEVYEGGVRSAGFVYSPLLPASTAGSSVSGLFHITDWLPTLAHAAGVPLTQKQHLPLDGHDMWDCILGKADSCPRKEVLMNFNTVCDVPSSPSHVFTTECPAPKAAVRVGDLKVLAECYNTSSGAFTGNVLLYNVTADPSESEDLSLQMPEALAELKERLRFFGAQAANVAPLSDAPPWQGEDYFCATCQPGEPQGPHKTWEPWCAGAGNVPCPKRVQGLEYI